MILVITDRLALRCSPRNLLFLYSCVHIRRASPDFLSFYLLRFLSTNGIHVFVCAVFVSCCIEVILFFRCNICSCCRHCQALAVFPFIASLFLDRRTFLFVYCIQQRIRRTVSINPSLATSLTNMTFGQRQSPPDTYRLILTLHSSSLFFKVQRNIVTIRARAQAAPNQLR